MYLYTYVALLQKHSKQKREKNTLKQFFIETGNDHDSQEISHWTREKYYKLHIWKKKKKVDNPTIKKLQKLSSKKDQPN